MKLLGADWSKPCPMKALRNKIRSSTGKILCMVHLHKWGPPEPLYQKSQDYWDSTGNINDYKRCCQRPGCKEVLKYWPS